MKKTLRFGAAACMLFSMQLAAPSALADTETGIADFIDDLCKPGVESGQYKSVGDCMGKSRQDVIDYCRSNHRALGLSSNGMCQKWAQQTIHNKNYE